MRPLQTGSLEEPFTAGLLNMQDELELAANATSRSASLVHRDPNLKVVAKRGFFSR